MDTEPAAERPTEVNSLASASAGRKLLLLAIFTGAAVRLYLLWNYYCISSDGVRYIEAARNFFAGRIVAGLGSVYPPAYSFMIAAIFPLVGDWELAGQLLSVGFGVSLLFPLFFLLREVFDETVAGCACLLASLSPFLARYSADVRSESAYLFFLVWALCLFAQGIGQNRAGRFFLGGLVAGFAYLVRPEAVGLLVLIPGCLAFQRIVQSRRSWAAIGKYCILLLAGFLVFGLPYIVYLSIDTGNWGAISRKAGITLAISLEKAGVLDAHRSGDGAKAEPKEFFALIRRHPVAYATNAIMNLPLAVGSFFEILHFSYVPFFLIGLFLTFRSGDWQRREFFLLSFVLFYLIALTMILVRRRYSLQLVPASLGWCAIGGLWLRDYCRHSLKRRASSIATASISVFFLGGTLPKTLNPISAEKAYVRNAGRYLGQFNWDDNLKIAVLDNRIPFYADAAALYLFDVKESALGAYLQRQKPDFLAADTKSLRHFFPHLSRRPGEYGLVFDREFVGTRKDRVLVFKVN